MMARFKDKIKSLNLRKGLITLASSIPAIAALSIGNASAATCPYGTMCSFPGQCPRYLDVNGDGMCDLSVGASTTTSSNDPSSTSSSDSISSSDSNSENIGQADSLNLDQQQDNGTVSLDNINDADSGLANGDGTEYYVLPVTIILFVGYLFTHYLFSKGILKRKEHRRLWNLLVSAGYVGTGITGVLLTLFINLGIKTVMNPSITFWHAELSILMVVGTMIHIHLYWNPVKNMFKVLFGIKPKQKENQRLSPGK